jgi:hypothetical protein
MRKNLGWWTSRESWLAVLFAIGALAIVAMARMNNVDPLIQAMFVVLFAVAVLVIWVLGRGPNAWPFRRGHVVRARSAVTRKK